MTTTNLNFTHSDCRLRKIQKVQFGIVNPDSLKNLPEINVVERFKNGIPVDGGLNDLRMGSVNRDIKCKTCHCGVANGSKVDDCPGHFGQMKLQRPVYHCGLIDQVLAVLRCVCFHCNKLLLDPKNPKDRAALEEPSPKKRFKLISELCKAKSRCASENADQLVANVESQTVQSGHCGRLAVRYTKRDSSKSRDGIGIVVEFPDDEEHRKMSLSASKAYQILKGISDDDVRTLGLNPEHARPEWFLVSVLPVPPPHVRPSVVFNGQQSEDDLTHALVDILKANRALEVAIKDGKEHIIRECEKSLQNRITNYFDNERQDTARTEQRNGRPLKTLRQRLRGKEGRLRGNLMGKRVDFSARTVITADPNLSIDQVGVPRSVALTLTVPVVVTAFNVDQLRRLVETGPDSWPGARYVIRNTDGARFDLSVRRDFELELGWTVERHLQDDDIVLFNRQPSLHKMSIMGHRAKILDWSTFRLNLSVTTPYNADFDGDEMNLHVPQSITARADAQELMMVPKNIVTPQKNQNVMGIVQDALLGVTRMTKRDVFIERDVFMNAMMWISDTWDGVLPTPAILKPRPIWTGKQLFSMVCPKINYHGTSKNADKTPPPDNFNYNDSSVLIHDGVLLQGIVDKNIVGTSGGSALHVCWLQKGWEETRKFMNQVQRTVNYWMVNTSYTVSVSDTVADANTTVGIRNTLTVAKEKVQGLMYNSLIEEGVEMQPGKKFLDSFEMHLNLVLNTSRSDCGKQAQNSLKERNNIKGTVMAGSKGSELNISQIIACVGQQNVQGQRIQNGFRQRTLPHFTKDDMGIEAKGFVENSYLRGLTPQEFYFHAMGGREGCIDTAVKTSETGYIQRRLVKAMETVMSRYDSTLRNSKGCIVQFLYGEDGMDAQRIEKQTLDVYTLGYDKFKEKCFLDTSLDDFGLLDHWLVDLGERASYLPSDMIHQCRNDGDLYSLMEAEFLQLEKDRETARWIQGSRGQWQDRETRVFLPVNIDRLIWNSQRHFGIHDSHMTDLHPRDVYEAVTKLCEKDLIVTVGDDPLSRESQANATLLFQILIRSKLATKRVLKEYRLTKASFDYLLKNIVVEFRQAIVSPGEMAGVLAAQSIGEPATQMTLNTFHNTGIGAKNVTLGVPRLNEILNVSKAIRTPSLSITLKDPTNQVLAAKLSSMIEYTTLGDIAIRTEIHFDPDYTTSVIPDDSTFVEEDYMVNSERFQNKNVSPWVIRVVLDSKHINARCQTYDFYSSLGEKVMDVFPDTIAINTDVNSDVHVLRVRLAFSNDIIQDDNDSVSDFDLMRQFQKKLLSSVHLYGISRIKKVYLSEKKAVMKWSDTEGFVKENPHWPLETDGSNLAAILTLDEVDHTLTTCNDVLEILDVLGIEAARKSLFNELNAVLSFDGAYVNCRHIACLADTMTFSGGIMAISRHGVNNSEAGPMLRASFEQTVEVFMKASSMSESDNLIGVTENVMLGQLGKLGTGMVDLMIDPAELMKNASSSFSDVSLGSGSSTPQYPHSPDMFQTKGWSELGGGGGSNAMFTPLPSFTPGPGSMTPHSPFYRTGSTTPSYGGMTPHYGGQTPLSLPSPHYTPGSSHTPTYSPHTPAYNPTSPSYSSAYSPNSPAYSPTSPAYSPNSPAYSPNSPAYSPNSPAYSPNSPAYSPNSPAYSPNSPAYSPNSPAYSPTSPAYSPTSPAYSPTSPVYSPTSPVYSPNSPAYSPSSPVYSMSSNQTSPSSGSSPYSPSYTP